MRTFSPLRFATFAAVLSAGLFSAPVARAESVAMIMTIGNYSNPGASLPGIDLDARTARKIAASMGISDANIIELKDAALSHAGVAAAFEALGQRINRGDNVFIYYSGHGTQRSGGNTGAKCSEGMVTYDMRPYDDADLEAALARLTAKAGQVVFLNDSCFSGGQATRSDRSLAAANRVPKAWKSSSSDSDYRCGNAVNARMTRNLVPTAAKAGSNLLYIAAANDNEVAFASSEGSSATVAWAHCLQANTDTDRSGMLTGRELQQCAQAYVRSQRYEQTITLVGNAELPLSFVQQGTGMVAADPLATLRNLRQQASSAIQVDLRTVREQLRIGVDFLDLSVTTGQDGYLYLIHVGSDGSSFDLLFPNERETNNFVKAGTRRLPGPDWGIQAMGPAGSSHIMAILTETPRKFDRGMRAVPGSPFRSTGASVGAARNLSVVAAGEGGERQGRLGASAIITISEVQ